MTIYQLLSNRPEVRVSNSLVFKWKFLQSIHIPVLYRSDTDIRQLGTGYNAVKWQDGVMTGQSTIDAGGGASFSVTCQWVVDGNILTLNHMLSVRGNQRGAGFYSAIRLYTAPELTWPDVSLPQACCMAIPRMMGCVLRAEQCSTKGDGSRITPMCAVPQAQPLPNTNAAVRFKF
jgi:hypothetical protein